MQKNICKYVPPQKMKTHNFQIPIKYISVCSNSSNFKVKHSTPLLLRAKRLHNKDILIIYYFFFRVNNFLMFNRKIFIKVEKNLNFNLFYRKKIINYKNVNKMYLKKLYMGYIIYVYLENCIMDKLCEVMPIQ